jgi:hypothetical protein
MTATGHDSPYARGVSYVRTWVPSGTNQAESGHWAWNVRNQGQTHHRTANAGTASHSHNLPLRPAGSKIGEVQLI